MAMIKCPECGKDISDKAAACPNCGCPISGATSDSAKLTFSMASQRFLVSATVSVSLDGEDVGLLSDGQSFSIDVPKGAHDLFLKGSMRKKEVKLNIAGDTRVDVKFNRMSGGLDALVFQ